MVPPEPFYQGIQCLLPAHYIWYWNGEISIHRYWELRLQPDESMTEDETVDKIEKVFDDSVKFHKISDVEVECFLSSGMDSSWVAVYFSGQKVFTVEFEEDESYNKIICAERVAKEKQLDYYKHLITADEFGILCQTYSILCISRWQTRIVSLYIFVQTWLVSM